VAAQTKQTRTGANSPASMAGSLGSADTLNEALFSPASGCQ
jgi:hypothetical protein